MVDLDEAVVVIFVLLIFAEGLADFLVGLWVFVLEFFEPPFCLFDTDLFYAHLN